MTTRQPNANGYYTHQDKQSVIETADGYKISSVVYTDPAFAKRIIDHFAPQFKERMSFWIRAAVLVLSSISSQIKKIGANCKKVKTSFSMSMKLIGSSPIHRGKVKFMLHLLITVSR